MSCACPVQVLANIGSLPVPVGYSVQVQSGACLTEAATFFYGVVAQPPGAGNDYGIVAWDYPGFSTRTDITYTDDILSYPCAVASNQYDPHHIYYLRTVPGSPTITRVRRRGFGLADHVIYTFTHPVDGGEIWGLRRLGSYLWVGFRRWTSPSNLQTGLIRLDPVTGASTEFEFSNGLENGTVAHLSANLDLAVTDDSAIWMGAYDIQPTAVDGFARFGAGAWTTTNQDLGTFDGPIPLDSGRVRMWDNNAVPAESKLIAASQSYMVDSCSGPEADMRTAGMLAWDGAQSLILYLAIDNRLMAITCVQDGSGGWSVGLIA